MSIAFTDKQIEIVRKILAAADAGEDLAFEKLWKSLSYYPVTKQAVHQSLRRLTRAGYIETFYGKNRTMTFRPTFNAYKHFRK